MRRWREVKGKPTYWFYPSLGLEGDNPKGNTLGNIPLIEEGDKDKATQGDNTKASNKLIIRDIMGKSCRCS